MTALGTPSASSPKKNRAALDQAHLRVVTSACRFCGDQPHCFRSSTTTQTKPTLVTPGHYPKQRPHQGRGRRLESHQYDHNGTLCLAITKHDQPHGTFRGGLRDAGQSMGLNVQLHNKRCHSHKTKPLLPYSRLPIRYTTRRILNPFCS